METHTESSGGDTVSNPAVVISVIDTSGNEMVLRVDENSDVCHYCDAFKKILNFVGLDDSDICEEIEEDTNGDF